MDAKEAKVYIAILITAGVIAIILVYFIVTILRQQKKNLTLHKEKIQAEINTLESERKRIASDLHDELGPVLSSVRLQLGCLNTEDEEDISIVRKSQEHMDNILQRLREISNDLMPNVLLRKGLVSAISEFANNMSGIHKIHIDFRGEENLSTSNAVNIHLYRIVQEIIHNTIKHAKAQNLAINIQQVNDRIVLQTRDDGIGFDYETLQKKGMGLGLSNMTSRLEILKGNIYNESSPGKGTAYTIEIPLVV